MRLPNESMHGVICTYMIVAMHCVYMYSSLRSDSNNTGSYDKKYGIVHTKQSYNVGMSKLFHQVNLFHEFVQEVLILER